MLSTSKAAPEMIERSSEAKRARSWAAAAMRLMLVAATTWAFVLRRA